jgi:ankyrin repeat protein
MSLAAKTGREEIVYALLVNNALPDIYDEDTGRTPLFYSVSENHRRISKELINFGASINLADYNCVSPLMVACSKDDKKHCSLLIKHAADVDAQDVHGW